LRLQVISLALFRTIGRTLGLFDDVTSANINAADTQTGKAADLECISDSGETVLAVEVKDRELNVRAVRDKIPQTREKGIRELLFLVQGGVSRTEQADVDATIEREFATGHRRRIARPIAGIKSGASSRTRVKTAHEP
jgi:hypothetical protein